MEIRESDRDALRKNQRKIHPKVIGNIIEYKPQNPRTYKKHELSNTINKLESLKLDQKPTKETVKPQVSNGKIKDVEPNGLIRDQKSKMPEAETISSSPASDLKKLPIPLEEVKKNSWLNMDKVEFDKMAWMFNPPKMDNQENTSLFDRNGMIVTQANDEKHHTSGKDSSIPPPELDLDANDEVFDIGQLAMLLDSGYQRQVSYALNVVKSIAELANKGFYDGVFSENIQSLLIKYYLLRVRHQMDNKDQTTRLTAFRCLAALICNTDVDEFYLDRIYTTICDSHEHHMRLRCKKGSEFNDKGEKLNDMQYAEVNPIMCLIERTNILQRFVYIMGDKSIPYYHDYLECIVDVLIRFARHSLKVCSLMNRKDILEVLVESCLPCVISLECDYIRTLCRKALKFFRIIAEAILEAKKTIELKLPQDNFPESMIGRIQNYFLINFEQVSLDDRYILIPLNIEAMRIVKVLSMLENFESRMLDLMILSQMHLFNEVKYLSGLESTKQMSPQVSINWQLAAHLIDLCGSFAKLHSGKIRFITDLMDYYIKNSFYNWLNDIIVNKFIPHLDVSISIVTAFKYLNNSFTKDGKLEEMIIDFTSKGYNTEFLRLLLRRCNEMSFLRRFSEINGKLRDPQCLPSYGILNFNREKDHKSTINPIVDSDSPFLLTNMFITKLDESQEVSKIAFVNDLNFTRYVRDATSYEHLPLSYDQEVKQSFLAQQEVKLIAKILLVLSRYYQEYRVPAKYLNEVSNKINRDECDKLVEIRNDCYSNICYYTIALIGLLNPRPEVDKVAYKLKSKLLEKILFSETFQYRLSRENSKLIDKSEESDLNLWQNSLTKSPLGDKLVYELDSHKNNTLFPLYETIPLHNRYWILEPLLQYYQVQTCYQKDEKAKDNFWFAHNVDWTSPTGEIITSSDAHLITLSLEFHFTILLYCPGYKQIIVKSNAEDFLCTLGTLFLHDDIFLDEKLNLFLMNNIRVIMNDCLIGANGKYQIPFKSAQKEIGSIDLPLGDFFEKLLEQFEAVSYGDTTFSNYLMLFITPESDITFRKKLFQEKADVCLPIIRIQEDDLFCPKELFFTKTEKNQEMKAILKGSMRYSKNSNLLLEYLEFHTKN